MSEVLSELVAKITTDAAGLKSGLSDAEKQTEASSKKMQDSLKKVGTAMAASGAAITAALGMMGKSAIDEEINIKRLATTMGNAGTAYDDVKDSLEAVIAATQRKTGVADDAQRDILNRLILTTGDYATSLALLPTVLDLAAAGEMDATTAATYLGKAHNELAEGAEEVSVRFGQASLKFKSMEDIQNRVANSAENLANPLSVLKASIGDVAEAIGAYLLPMIKGAVDKIVDIAIKVQDWTNEHPELTKRLTLLAGALGIFLGVVGTGLLLLPKLKAAWMTLQLVFTASPWGAIIAGIGLVIAAGIALWQNWDKVSHFLGDVWSNIKQIFLQNIDFVLSALEKFLGWLPGIGDKIKSARESIGNMIDREKISRDIKDTERDLEELTKTVKEEFEKQSSEIQANYDKQRVESQKAYDAAVEAINKEYGIGEAAKDVSETKIDAAKRATAELKEQYKREEDAATDRYNFEMQQVRDLYSERLRALNAETDAQVKALQNQIDAIDQQTAAEELAITRSEEAKRLAELQGAYESAENDKDAAKAYEAWKEYETQVARNELLRTRDEEKTALRDQIAEARERAQSRKEQIQAEEDAALASLKTKYEAEIANYNALAEAADTDLENELARIETERLKAIEAQNEILKTELNRLDTAEREDIEFLTNQLKRANTQVKDINLTYDALQKRYDIEIVTHYIDEYSSSGEAGGVTNESHDEIIARMETERNLLSKAGSGISATDMASFYAGGFATGGVVPGVIGQPYLATVHGGETIIPANESMGGVTVNFTQPVFFDREDTMNRFVDKISKTLDRKYRLGGRL